MLGELLLLRRPHLLALGADERLARALPHPKRRQHRRLRLVGHGAALPLHQPDVGGVGLGPLALGALARVDDDRARAHARQRHHLLRRGAAPAQLARVYRLSHLAAGQRCDLRGD